MKLLFTVGLVLVVLVLRWVTLGIIRAVLGGRVRDPRRFWARQGIQVMVAVVLVLGVVSIWITPEHGHLNRCGRHQRRVGLRAAAGHHRTGGVLRHPGR